jgi:hypothetical protein
MANPNDPTVANFFNVFTPGDPHYQGIPWLMNNFCAQAGPPGNPTRPTVGIAGAAGGMVLSLRERRKSPICLHNLLQAFQL